MIVVLGNDFTFSALERNSRETTSEKPEKCLFYSIIKLRKSILFNQ